MLALLVTAALAGDLSAPIDETITLDVDSSDTIETVRAGARTLDGYDGGPRLHIATEPQAISTADGPRYMVAAFKAGDRKFCVACERAANAVKYGQCWVFSATAEKVGGAERVQFDGRFGFQVHSKKPIGGTVALVNKP